MNVTLAFVLLLTGATSIRAQEAQHHTRRVLFVMTDGLRWQEVFNGADEALMNKENGGVADVDALKQAYWRNSSKARREALMPFLWSVIARSGQIYGNRDLGSDAYVTNGLNFSYPGYSETLCGFADPRIKSNDKVPNPNVTVLEWLADVKEILRADMRADRSETSARFDRLEAKIDKIADTLSQMLADREQRISRLEERRSTT